MYGELLCYLSRHVYEYQLKGVEFHDQILEKKKERIFSLFDEVTITIYLSIKLTFFLTNLSTNRTSLEIE
jgi:hypothetical protein